MNALPPGHRIFSFETVVTVKGLGPKGRSRHRSRVWVVLGRPTDPRVDQTQPEVTHRYLSRRGLVAGLADGSAWLDEGQR